MQPVHRCRCSRHCRCSQCSQCTHTYAVLRISFILSLTILDGSLQATLALIFIVTGYLSAQLLSTPSLARTPTLPLLDSILFHAWNEMMSGSTNAGFILYASTPVLRTHHPIRTYSVHTVTMPTRRTTAMHIFECYVFSSHCLLFLFLVRSYSVHRVTERWASCILK